MFILQRGRAAFVGLIIRLTVIHLLVERVFSLQDIKVGLQAFELLLRFVEVALQRARIGSGLVAPRVGPAASVTRCSRRRTGRPRRLPGALIAAITCRRSLIGCANRRQRSIRGIRSRRAFRRIANHTDHALLGNVVVRPDSRRLGLFLLARATRGHHQRVLLLTRPLIRRRRGTLLRSCVGDSKRQSHQNHQCPARNTRNSHRFVLPPAFAGIFMLIAPAAAWQIASSAASKETTDLSRQEQEIQRVTQRAQSVYHSAEGLPMRTIIFPVFSPDSTPISAAGAFSKPSTKCSRYLILPSFSHFAICPTPSAKCGANWLTINPCALACFVSR